MEDGKSQKMSDKERKILFKTNPYAAEARNPKVRKQPSQRRWIGEHTKVIVTCRIHGDFIVEAGAHLRGEGCPSCDNETRNRQETTT